MGELQSGFTFARRVVEECLRGRVLFQRPQKGIADVPLSFLTPIKRNPNEARVNFVELLFILLGL